MPNDRQKKIAPVSDELKLYDPFRNDFVSESGRVVTLNQYWDRRIIEGAAKIITEPEPEEN